MSEPEERFDCLRNEAAGTERADGAAAVRCCDCGRPVACHGERKRKRCDDCWRAQRVRTNHACWAAWYSRQREAKVSTE